MTWKELVERWNSKSPAIFIKIQNFGIKLGSVGTSMLVPTVIPNVTSKVLSIYIPAVGAAFIVAGICIGIVAKLACQDPSKLDTTDK